MWCPSPRLLSIFHYHCCSPRRSLSVSLLYCFFSLTSSLTHRSLFNFSSHFSSLIIYNSSPLTSINSLNTMKMRKCELCNADAAVFCPSDAAFLCSTCDAKVHEANFLVARHLRRPICNILSGALAYSTPSAAACPQEEDGTSCVSSTTDCSSRRRTSRARVNHPKAEGVFVNWCGKLGVESGSAVRAACRALKVCVDRWTALPFRVSLAASMWLGLQLNLEKSAVTWKVLERLEEISGVPAKIILAAASKLGRAVRAGELEHRRQLELVEGWAEC